MSLEITQSDLVQIYLEGIKNTPQIGNDPVPTVYVALAAACVAEAIRAVCRKANLELPKVIDDRNYQ